MTTPLFSIEGSTDPFLVANLRQGQTIVAESGAMASMDDTIDLGATAQGGMLKSLIRKTTTGESFFMQEITAARGDGRVLLAPSHPGEVRVVECAGGSWTLSDGAFLAAENTLQIETSRQKSMGGAFVGGTGGFLVMKISGTGSFAVASLGAITEVELQPGRELIVDNGHAVAWPDTVEMRASMSTKEEGGFLKKMARSVGTGEGVVLRLRGSGRVLVSSRNSGAFIGWISAFLPSSG